MNLTNAKRNVSFHCFEIGTFLKLGVVARFALALAFVFALALALPFDFDAGLGLGEALAAIFDFGAIRL